MRQKLFVPCLQQRARPVRPARASMVCQATVFDPLSAATSAIGEALRDNFLVLGLCAVVLGLAAFALAGVAINAIDAVRNYYTYVVKPSPASTAASADDEKYGRREGGAAAAADAEESEYRRVQDRLARVKRLYGAYNREITRYARDVKDREPDDVMDERILDAADDNWK